MAKPNVLFFDEPTNDLDIETLTILEEFLETFNGALITISHDRYFLDKVVDKIFAFENGIIRSYPGGYTDYEEKRQPLEKKEKEKGVRVRSAIPQMTSKEKKEFEGIDQRLEEIGEELKQIDEMCIRDSFHTDQDITNINKHLINRQPIFHLFLQYHQLI